MSPSARFQLIANNQPDLVEPYIKDKEEASCHLRTIAFTPSSLRYLMQDVIKGLSSELIASESGVEAWQVNALLDEKIPMDVLVVQKVLRYCGISMTVEALIKIARRS